MISIAIFSGCAQQDIKTIDNEKNVGNETIISTPGSTQELKKFSSAYELREYLKASAQSTGAFAGSNMGRAITQEGATGAAVPMQSGVMPKAVTSNIQAPSGETATDYSKTNIQVEGVHEADATILSSTLIEGRPKDLFVNGDRLLIFMEDTDTVYGIPEYDYMPRPRDAMKTVAMVYDISNRKNPMATVFIASLGLGM